MDALPAIELVSTARRDILDYSLYSYRGVRMVDLVHASRGCRFHCAPARPASSAATGLDLAPSTSGGGDPVD